MGGEAGAPAQVWNPNSTEIELEGVWNVVKHADAGLQLQ